MFPVKRVPVSTPQPLANTAMISSEQLEPPRGTRIQTT